MTTTSMTLCDAVRQITQQLTPISTTPRLDAELLTAAIFRRSRSWLFANFQQPLAEEHSNLLKDLTQRRAMGEPMAYILGHQEFWGLKIAVTKDVLIPRPETEHIIEWVLTRYPPTVPLSVADLGTGSGAIALALASERALWEIHATDDSVPALTVAKQNAQALRTENIHFHLGHWCAPLPLRKYDLMISNPPYIAENDPHLTHLPYEPQRALRSGADGLDAIREIIALAPDYLASMGYLILEHGYDQAHPVTQILRQRGFTDIQTHHDLAGHPRFATARFI